MRTIKCRLDALSFNIETPVCHKLIYYAMTIEGIFPHKKSDTECQHQIIIIIIFFEEAVFHLNEDFPFLKAWNLLHFSV